MATTNLQTAAITDGIRQVAVETAERVVREALGLGTKYISVNDDNPVLLIDEYFYAMGVGRNLGLKKLLADGYVEPVEGAGLKALGLKRGDKRVFVPTEKGEEFLTCAAHLDASGAQGRNTTKLLVKVPEGMDYLSAKVFTPEVRLELYREAWGV
jgi:hypothetical protein